MEIQFYNIKKWECTISHTFPKTYKLIQIQRLLIIIFVSVVVNKATSKNNFSFIVS